MDYRPNANTSLEEQRRKDLIRNAFSGHTAPTADNAMGVERAAQQPGQQHLVSPAELSRLNLANLEARMAAQGALAARVQAVQQAQGSTEYANDAAVAWNPTKTKSRLSPGLTNEKHHNAVFSPESKPSREGITLR